MNMAIASPPRPRSFGPDFEEEDENEDKDDSEWFNGKRTGFTIFHGRAP